MIPARQPDSPSLYGASSVNPSMGERDAGLARLPHLFIEVPMDPITIFLAGKPYTVRPLTLGQSRDLGIGVTLPDVTDPQDAVRRSFDRAVAVISVALSADYPEMPPKAIYDMRSESGQTVTREEMRVANDTVLRLAGFIAEPKPGEAEAGAA